MSYRILSIKIQRDPCSESWTNTSRATGCQHHQCQAIGIKHPDPKELHWSSELASFFHHQMIIPYHSFSSDLCCSEFICCSGWFILAHVHRSYFYTSLPKSKIVLLSISSTMTGNKHNEQGSSLLGSQLDSAAQGPKKLFTTWFSKLHFILRGHLPPPSWEVDLNQAGLQIPTLTYLLESCREWPPLF